MSPEMTKKVGVVRWHTLVELTALSRSTLADFQNPRSKRFDDRFPQKIQLGKRAVGWLLQDVEGWLQERKYKATKEVATK